MDDQNNNQGYKSRRSEQQSTDKEERRKQRRQTFPKIQGLDSRRFNGGVSDFDERRGGNSSQNGLVK